MQCVSTPVPLIRAGRDAMFASRNKFMSGFCPQCCSYAKKVSPIRGVIKGKAQPLLAALLFGSAVLAFNGGLRPLLTNDEDTVFAEPLLLLNYA